MNELNLISLLPMNSQQLVIPIGDDCGEITWGGANLLASCDLLIDGEHFDSKVHSPEQVAFKALRVNISDIAAMAGKPVAVMLAVGFSRHLPDDFPSLFLKHFSNFCASDAVVLLGGDTNFTDGPTNIAVTILGSPHALGSVKRSGARIGDDIFVSGQLGGSYESNRHLSPRNLTTLAEKIADTGGVHAMIDLSDGLATDLRHILKASQCGAKLNLNQIPLHPDVAQVESALVDGEDFELCFAAAPNFRLELTNLGCVRIGVVTDKIGVLELEDQENRVFVSELRGFEHKDLKNRSTIG